MKILYAIQGTGNGHISRAREIIPYLKQYGELDLLISGTQADVQLPYPVKYKLKGVGFVFGIDGGIDMKSSFKQLHPLTFIKDIYEIPVKEYDLVINDYEPVTAWACKIHQINCIAISHQAAFLSKHTPRIKKKDKFAENVLKNYAPCTDKIAFHFVKMPLLNLNSLEVFLGSNPAHSAKVGGYNGISFSSYPLPQKSYGLTNCVLVSLNHPSFMQ